MGFSGTNFVRFTGLGNVLRLPHILKKEREAIFLNQHMSQSSSCVTRVQTCVCACVCVTMERKCQTNGKHDKRYQRYFKYVTASTTQGKIQQE